MQKRYLASGLLLVMVSIAAVNFYLPSTTGKFAESKKITASLLIDYGLNTRNTTIELRSGASAFDALSAAAEIGYKEYEGLGKLITSIDNLSQNSTHYWLYFEIGRASCRERV